MKVWQLTLTINVLGEVEPTMRPGFFTGIDRLQDVFEDSDIPSITPDSEVQVDLADTDPGYQALVHAFYQGDDR